MKKRYMKGLSPMPDRVAYSKQYDSVIEMSDANYDKCTNSNWFKYGEDGKARLKTAAELKVDADKLAKENGRKEAKQIREDALHDCTVELNGNVFQTRPSDESNFRLSIAGLDEGEKTEWILKDNTVVEVTKEDLDAVYVLGLKEVNVIFSVYKEALKAL
jgi:hypothetical protein